MADILKFRCRNHKKCIEHINDAAHLAADFYNVSENKSLEPFAKTMIQFSIQAKMLDLFIKFDKAVLLIISKKQREELNGAMYAIKFNLLQKLHSGEDNINTSIKE